MDPTSQDERSLRSLFNGSPLTLMEICSLKVAVSLWKHVLFRDKVSEKVGRRLRSLSSGENSGELVDDLHIAFFVDVEKASKALKLPQSIAECTRKSCKQVGKEMNEWIEHMKYRTVHSYVLTMFRSHLKCCMWYSNGAINYKESARKFISIANIDKAQKFEIASHFCLEDVTIDLCESPDTHLLQLMKNFTKKIRSHTRPLLYYWLCKTTNQMGKLPRDQTGSVEAFLLTHNVTYYRWSIEYFLDCSSEQHQITMATRLIQQESPLCEMNPKELAVKMNEYQLTAVLSAVPVDFLSKLMDYDEQQLAFSVWTYVKDWIDGEQFVTLMKKLIRNSDWLMKVWNSAYDNQKDTFLSQDKRVIIETFFHPNEFSISVLSYASEECRKELFLEYAYTLAKLESRHHDYISKIIQLCLPNPSDAEVKEFGKAAKSPPNRENYGFCGNTLMDARKRCVEFLKLYFPKNYETLKHNPNFMNPQRLF